MTSRERWVVYPLLFLTFGMTMRDKVWPQPHFIANDMTAFGEITAGKIICSQLDVGRATAQRLESIQSECQLLTLSDQHGRNAIRLGSGSNGTGRLELLATDGDVLVALGGDEVGESGRVETFADGGVPQTQLRSTEAGGLVTAIDAEENIWLILGHYADQYGVFAESAEARRRVPLTIPWRFETAVPDKHYADGTSADSGSADSGSADGPIDEEKADEEEESVE
ncbi:MAG TPA: hypothetical protein VE890_06735 [Thermoguttaceae bacterium]|nr:hypothetical protein [Thermoguttaceae bacterium]